MTETITLGGKTVPPDRANWGAVFSLALSVTGLVTAELLPISLLTPIAHDLNVTEGMAGQAVSTTALVALVASLFTAAATRRLDRRIVLLFFTLMFIASNALVASASHYAMLLAGRVLLGVSLGGFWSMAAAVTMRLVPEAAVPRALSIIFGGVSVAMAVSAPIGTYLGGVIGWRGVFLVTAVLGVAALVWQFIILPSMAPSGQSRLSTLFGLLGRPQIALGMIGMILVFGGHFAFFTYLRPFLETVTRIDVSGVSIVLLGFGIANVVGTVLSGAMIRRSLRLTLAVMPILMSVLALGLVMFGSLAPNVAALVATWGFAFGAVPVAWTTWLTRTVPDETESGGGLQVAAIQLAITAGAGVGGILLDATGSFGAITGSGVILIIAAALILIGLRPRVAV
jgi:predicted MFS family arabinose efflux permease